MPGPPSEMEPMWREAVQARLEGLFSGKTAMLSLMTFGLGESAVEERIDDVIAWHPDVTVATYAKAAGVEVHVTARATSDGEAEALAQEAKEKLQERLGDAVFGSGEDTLPAVVGRALERRGWTLAVMESATGGLLASMITDQAGSSNYFVGGIVTYSRDAKERYGVDARIMDEHGLISGPTALAMAEAARLALGADVGMGVTGIAGTEPIEGKPPGTVYIGVVMDGCREVREIHRPGPRPIVKGFAAQCALDLLRRQLLIEKRAEV
jgi:nicotinamide-nucleotide amidase